MLIDLEVFKLYDVSFKQNKDLGIFINGDVCILGCKIKIVLYAIILSQIA